MSVPAPEELVNEELVEAISARLDLRAPNREALELMAYRLAEHYDEDGNGAGPGFEGVADVATGVGKTYVLAAAIEYFASLGTRNFAVIAPGKTIERKTKEQFQAGTPKSLLGGMEVEPVVVTSDNFNSQEAAAAFDDNDQVKLYVFTVQALLKPESKVGRKTHKFQEGLGKNFYDHLVSRDDLFVFADEHHCYFGKKFSDSVRGLKPYALIGLTATPHKKTPPEQIFYRYPLAAAIADQLVKAPVIVGRSDDRADWETKLLDATRLLVLKEQAIKANKGLLDGKTVNPVMLIVAKSIEDADEVGKILRAATFANGRYAAADADSDPVLVVHSDAPDEALEKLDQVEDPDSPVRAIVSVGMLKEGWDVKNVYVIVSLRSSVSEILTEQTLGRGLRLPFGSYTGIEILDTLEVIAHERYNELLKKHKAINESFIDLQTHLEVRRNALGQKVIVAETVDVQTPVSDEGAAAGAGNVAVTSIEDRKESAEAEVASAVELAPREDLPSLYLPKVTTEKVTVEFSLNDLPHGEYNNPFRELGERLAVDPSDVLRRTRLGARVIVGDDGLRRTVTTTSDVADRVKSGGRQLQLGDARTQLLETVSASAVVAPRKEEIAAAGEIVDAVIDGMKSRAGEEKASEILTAYIDRAAQRIIELITEEQRKHVKAPKITEKIEPELFAPVRAGRLETSDDRKGDFKRGVGITGWKKSMYAQAWFDSSTERDVANILDDAGKIKFWVRLLVKRDVQIAWEGGNYNPDFVAVETDGTHWLIEVKSDKDAESEDVTAKRKAAVKWAKHVSSAPKMNGVKWRYLLVREADVAAAKGEWAALKGLGTA
jgi:type III restriction enzyme